MCYNQVEKGTSVFLTSVRGLDILEVEVMGDASAKEEGKELRAKVDSLKQDFADLARAVKAQAATHWSKAREKIIEGPGEWAKGHPAASIGIVAGVAASVGFILGLIVGRGRD